MVSEYAKPYATECRRDVARVARNREPVELLKTIAADFGVNESFLTNWVKIDVADVEDDAESGDTAA